MENIKNNKNIKFIFLILWCFLIIRITSYIIFDSSHSVRFAKDMVSGIIFISLTIYLLISFYKKKPISKTFILIIYPIFGVIGYFFNGLKNDYQESILIHHFLTLTTIFIYFAFLQSNKAFNYKFKELLLKIIIIFCIFYSIVNILPYVIIKLYNFEDLRITSNFVINILGNEINFKQNINGQSKFLFLVFLICLILFKKFYFTKKNISIGFYLLSLFFITTIFLSQARFNILASFIISFFVIFNIKNLKTYKKFIYILLIIFVPLIIFDFYSEKKSRFSNEYRLYYTPFKDNSEFNKKIIKYKSSNQIQILRKDLELKVESKNELIDDYYNLENEEKIIIYVYKKFLFDIDSYSQNTESFDYDNYTRIFRAHNFIEENLKSNPELKSMDKLNLLYMELKEKTDVGKLIILKDCSNFIYNIDRILSGRVCGWETLIKIASYKDLILGKGFFADQVYLDPLEKTSSNSYFNILFNTGIINILIFVTLIIIFFTNYFKIKNINNDNIYISLSHYLIFYFIIRAFFEDTLAFVSIDFLLFGISLILIKQFITEKKN